MTNNHSECLFCNSPLVRGPDADDMNEDLIYQKCKDCGAYGYYQDQIEELAELDSEQRDQLLALAKKHKKRHNDTPVLNIDELSF